MYENTQGSGMGVTGIWDLIVLVIIARMFGFGDDRNNTTTAAVTEAQIERAIRASQDVAENRAAQTAIQLGQKDIINGQTVIADSVAKAASDIIANNAFVALQTENRENARGRAVAENALNNCNQTAAVSAIVQGAIAPLAQQVAAIIGQLNCGVKSIPYTASVPAYLPPMQPPPPYVAAY